MTEYKLVNPHIEGKFQKLYSGETPFDAAKNMWENLSANFTNCVPEFAFSLERVKDNKMFHFKVKESVKKDEVDFIITELNLKLSAAKKKKFDEKLSTFKNKVQSGGKKHKKGKKRDDDEDSDSDFYDLYLLTDHVLYETPITYFWYYPDFYPFDYDYYFVPTWIPTLSPYVLYSW
jgi:hypothetical protein